MGVVQLGQGSRALPTAQSFDAVVNKIVERVNEHEGEVLSFAASPLDAATRDRGAHVWAFFDGPVAAATARSLGSSLLREAMTARAELDLSSYDRFFPSQDFMPTGSFGNLIALPLHGERLTHGATARHRPYWSIWSSSGFGASRSSSSSCCPKPVPRRLEHGARWLRSSPSRPRPDGR